MARCMRDARCIGNLECVGTYRRRAYEEGFCGEALVIGLLKCMIDDQGLEIQEVVSSGVDCPSLTTFIPLSISSVQDTTLGSPFSALRSQTFLYFRIPSPPRS